MNHSFRSMIKELRKEVSSERARKVFCEARANHPVLEKHDGFASVLLCLTLEHPDGYPERDALTRALLVERQRSRSSVCASVLLVAYFPMLSRLRNKLVCSELGRDDLDQLVLESFLVAVSSFSPSSWPDRTAMRLHQATRKRVFWVLRKELEERRVRDGEEPTSGAILLPLSYSAVQKNLEKHIRTREGQRLFRATMLGKLTPKEYAKRVATGTEDEKRRTYQRLKRQHSRIRRRLCDLVVDR